ncbi:MAG: DUF4391 domain-containing protein [Polaromonas sp.]
MTKAANPFSQAPALVQALALPASAYVGQRIAKTLLMAQIANLPGTTPSDKRLANDLLAELHWLAALKPATCGLAVWQTTTHDYLEIAVLHAVLRDGAATSTLRSGTQLTRLIELIHRTIPYPVVLIVSQPNVDGATEQISLAHKRLSLGTGSAMVLEHTATTQPITTKSIAPCAGITGATAHFVHYLAFNRAPGLPPLQFNDLHARYSDWLHAIEALAAAKHTGQFIVSPSAPHAAQRRSSLAAYDQLGQQLASLRAQAGKESQLGQRAALNVQIAKRMAERQALLGSL